MTVRQCYLGAPGLICAAGDSSRAVQQNLQAAVPALTRIDAFGAGREVSLGMYHGDLPALTLSAPKWQSRNNRFAYAALQQIETQVSDAIERYGAGRVGVVIGSSTSGIAESEAAVDYWVKQGAAPEGYDYAVQEMGACAEFIAELLQLGGPVYGISTACSSGAKALASARRLLRAGLCDAVIAGGVDTLCNLTVMGFSSLEAVSDGTCNPFSLNRDGINIGEAAALFLVSTDAGEVRLSGVGENSDAYHISAPEPTGESAANCMRSALDDAGIDASAIDYVNLHGTATPLNDQMESRAIAQVFGCETACSSTKPFTGHTLGAAGALEAGICWLSLADREGWQPVHLWDGIADPGLAPVKLVTAETVAGSRPRRILSNSFAFGGNNIALVMEAAG